MHGEKRRGCKDRGRGYLGNRVRDEPEELERRTKERGNNVAKFNHRHIRIVLL